MNTLEVLIKMRNLPPKQVMNWLQDKGIISDLCVAASDVCTSDCAKACKAVNAQLILREAAGTYPAPQLPTSRRNTPVAPPHPRR
jgi:hypothetical protein